MRTSGWLIRLALVLGVALSLNAAPILLNGSFELGTAPGSLGMGTRCTSVACSPVNIGISGWTIVGEVDYIENLWLAAEGLRSVDLTGGPKGSPGVSGVLQTFDTLPSHLYMVSFYLAGNPDGAPKVKSLVTGAEGYNPEFSFDTTGMTHESMGWVQHVYYFTATHSAVTLSFTTTDSDYGPVIDNVSVTDLGVMIPEPASLLLLGAGLFGLAGLGRLLRKR